MNIIIFQQLNISIDIYRSIINEQGVYFK